MRHIKISFVLLPYVSATIAEQVLAWLEAPSPKKHMEEGGGWAHHHVTEQRASAMKKKKDSPTQSHSHEEHHHRRELLGHCDECKTEIVVRL